MKGLLFSSPFLLGFLLFTAVPMIISLYLSFTSYDVLQPPRWVGTMNFAQLAQDAALSRALWNTLAYAGLSVPLNVVLGLLVALLLNQNARGLAVWRSIY